MTVIVGIKTDEGICIGADRLGVSKGKFLSEFLRVLELDNHREFVGLAELMVEEGLDKASLSYDRKIRYSQERKIAIAQTGTLNEPNQKVLDLLLRPTQFLEDTEFLGKILFPCPLPKELREQAMVGYQFDLWERLTSNKIPEVRAIFNHFSVEEHNIDLPWAKKTFWDQNYHPCLSEYIIGLEQEGELHLCELTSTGAVYGQEVATHGSGGRHAERFLQGQKISSLQEAIKAVQEAVEYANSKDLFCHGFDYVVITKDRIEEHFGEDAYQGEIPLIELIERKERELQVVFSRIEKIKEYLR